VSTGLCITERVVRALFDKSNDEKPDADSALAGGRVCDDDFPEKTGWL
jgi:hypothetical protein